MNLALPSFPGHLAPYKAECMRLHRAWLLALESAFGPIGVGTRTMLASAITTFAVARWLRDHGGKQHVHYAARAQRALRGVLRMARNDAMAQQGGL